MRHVLYPRACRVAGAPAPAPEVVSATLATCLSLALRAQTSMLATTAAPGTAPGIVRACVETGVYHAWHWFIVGGFGVCAGSRTMYGGSEIPGCLCVTGVLVL